MSFPPLDDNLPALSAEWCRFAERHPLGFADHLALPDQPAEAANLGSVAATYSFPITERGTPWLWFANSAPLAAPIKDRFGIQYPTVEHLLHATLTGDEVFRRALACTPSIHLLRELASMMPIPPLWHETVEKALKASLRAKFSREPWRNLLLASGSLQLVEFNTHGDDLFGFDLYRGRGANLTGAALMALRSELQHTHPAAQRAA